MATRQTQDGRYQTVENSLTVALLERTETGAECIGHLRDAECAERLIAALDGATHDRHRLVELIASMLLARAGEKIDDNLALERARNIACAILGGSDDAVRFAAEVLAAETNDRMEYLAPKAARWRVVPSGSSWAVSEASGEPYDTYDHLEEAQMVCERLNSEAERARTLGEVQP